MKNTLTFVIDFTGGAFKGGVKYYAWLLFLLFFILVGTFTAYRQFTTGIILTGVTDQVTWELYMSNFVFMVGVAAAAVTVVFPSYIYKHKHLKELYVIGEILAMCAVPMCILFIMFHMGRPDKLWHIIPIIGYFNLPHSMLDYDVIALNGYLFINAIGVFYYLYKRYTGQPLNKTFYMPLIFLSIIWAPSIHVLTAFILTTLSPMHLWGTSAMPLRFLATAFAAGPSLIIIILLIVRKNTKLFIHDKAIDFLAQLVVWCLGITILLTVSEAVTELYAKTGHADSLKYLMFGEHGLHEFVPWFWLSMALIVGAFVMLLFPGIRKEHRFFLPLACAMTFAGTWIEKGMTLVLPGFIPTPLGEYVQYYPTWIEIFNCIFIWALGFFVFSVLLNGAIKIMTRDVRHPDALEEQHESGGA
jgi:molybdopterin-containing oxidoreductase family membrane subunit